jgi:outer membrane protein assembly factor BamB
LIKLLWKFYLYLILVVILGCSTIGDKVTNFMGGEDNSVPPTPLEDIEQRITIERIWIQDIGDGTDEQYLKLAPVYFQDKLFVAESDGDVKAIDARSGKTLWNHDIDSRITGGPGGADNLVMVGTSEAELISLSPDTGNEIWRARVSSEILAKAAIADNIVVARTIDGKIFGLNADDGKRLWVYDRTVPTLTLRGTSAPVIARNYVLAGFDEGRLVAIELLTGKLVWETRVALGSGRSELERMVDIDAEPVIVDDVIYVATFQGRIAALALDSGRILWTRDISSYAGLCADKSAIYITDDNSTIWSLDRFTGNSIWKQDKLSARAATGPEIIANMVVVGDLEGYLHWLNKATGEIAGRNRMSSNMIIAPPISVSDIIYSYASDGTLGAFSYSDNNLTDLAPAQSESETAEIPQVQAEAEPVPEPDAEAEPEEPEEGSLLDKLLEKFGSDGDNSNSSE